LEIETGLEIIKLLVIADPIRSLQKRDPPSPLEKGGRRRFFYFESRFELPFLRECKGFIHEEKDPGSSPG